MNPLHIPHHGIHHNTNDVKINSSIELPKFQCNTNVFTINKKWYYTYKQSNC